MNKQMVKKAAAFGIVAVLSVGAVFAKPHQPNSKDWKHSDDAGFNERPMMQGDKGVAPMGNSIMGKWVARDENKAVKVEFRCTILSIKKAMVHSTSIIFFNLFTAK